MDTKFMLKQKPAYLTPVQCAYQFADDILNNNNIAVSMLDKVTPSCLNSLTNISLMYWTSERSLFLSIVAEIGSLCSDKYYERVQYLISFLNELIYLHNNEKYRHLIGKYLDQIVYADLTDHFISYPIILQIEIMSIIEKTSIFNFPLIRDYSEADQSKMDLFLQDAARYFHNASSRKLYRSIVYRLDSNIASQQSIMRALIIGCVFLPLTCHSAFLNELYCLLSSRPYLLTSDNIEVFFNVLSPTGINQSHSVARAYLSQILFVRLFHLPNYCSQIVKFCFLIYLRVPNIRINLLHIIEPLCETDVFQQYLEEQQYEYSAYSSNVSILEPLFQQIRDRMKRGFQLKQLCRMKIRHVLAKNKDEDIISQVNRLNDVSETNKLYITYNLQSLIHDPDRFYESIQPNNEPVWNSSIPPPPID